jgi:hypothetical protein
MRQTESVVVERPSEDSRAAVATPRVGSVPHLTLDAVAGRGDPPTHAQAFSRFNHEGGFRRAAWLESLQRSHGNRYVQRVLALERAQSLPGRTGLCGTTVSRQADERPADTADVPAQEFTPAPPAVACESIRNEPRLVACLGLARLRPGDSDQKGRDHAISTLQQGLILAGFNIRDSEIGTYGADTSVAIPEFKRTKLHGFKGAIINDVGPLTVKTLSEEFCPPAPQPVAKASLDPLQCDPGGSTMSISGAGFPNGSVVALTVGDKALAEALADDKTGRFQATIKITGLDEGTHVIEAKSGSSRARTQFSTPCGSQPPKPVPVDPNVVTQNELLVLTKYEFLGQTERDALEDAIRDIKDKIDPTPVSWDRELAAAVGGAIIQFTYGGFEAAILTAIKNVFPPQQGKSLDAATIVNNANDKASDFLEDFGKDGFKKAIAEEDQQPTKDVVDQLEIFRRTQLRGIREGYLKVATDWIAKVQADPATADITPDELQGLAKSIDQTSAKLYNIRYLNVLQLWSSYIARNKLGGRTVTTQVNNEPVKQFSLTNLALVGDKAPTKVPGVLLIGLLGTGGNKELPSARDEGLGEASILINQNDVHIFGMSGTTRRELARAHPGLRNLHMPVVLRGNPRTGGFVAIGRNEVGGIVDAGSDAEGKQWLIEVGRLITGNSTLSDPGAGAEAVFNEHLSEATIEADIQGP